MTRGQAGGLAAIAVIVVVVVIVVVKMQKTTAVACALTSQGLSAVIEQSRFHNSGAALVAAAAVDTGCVPLANALIDRSSEPVEFELEDAAGEPEYELTAIELFERPPPPSGESDAGRIVRCFIAYRRTDFLYELCADGVIEP
jgi:hypothetical protein